MPKNSSRDGIHRIDSNLPCLAYAIIEENTLRQGYFSSAGSIEILKGCHCLFMVPKFADTFKIVDYYYSCIVLHIKYTHIVIKDIIIIKISHNNWFWLHVKR